jgi:radical SAM superfamily enzyme YgiQ (UPF0313 family)
MANIIFYSQIGYRPFVWRPIACYTLARWLEEHGYTCQVIEFTHLFSPQELVDYTKMFIDETTLLIGASTTMWTTWDSQLKMNNARIPSIPENIKYAIEQLKKEFPKVKTVVGGPVTYRTKNIDTFDFKIYDAYGENGLLKLMDELSEQTISTKIRRKNFDISNHRFVYKEHDCILPGECLPIEWGRGCIFQCSFCRDPGLGKKPGTDEKNISLMVDEFTEMYEKFGTTSYYFLDDTFNASLDRLESLEKVYNKLPFKLEFLAYNRADLLDKQPHTQEILHNCGQRGALFGIETFHPTAAKKVSKPWSAKRGKDFLLEIQEKWKHTHIDCHFIAGLPGENFDNLMDTAHWLKKTKIGFYWFIPLIMLEDQKHGLWEKNSEEHSIIWKNPTKPYDWEWNEWSYTKAYNTASLLNRVVEAHTKFSMWNLGSFKTCGLDMMDCVNKDISYVFNKLGDIYDHEERLFKQYKEILKSKAGR